MNACIDHDTVLRPPTSVAARVRTRFPELLRCLPALCLLVAPMAPALAQLFVNPIEGTNPNTADPYTEGQTHHANITVSGIGRGPGILANDANNRYNARAWSTTFDATDHFHWTLTPDPGYAMNLESLVYTGQTSTTGPTTAVLRSSVDGYTNDIGSPTITGATIDLGGPAYQNITSPITFRIHGYGGSNASVGTFSINDFAFHGTVTAQGLTVSLNASGYNGFHVSCFGGKDGWIEAVVTGGTPPYSYVWSNQDTTPTLSDMPAGYYGLVVTDADSTQAVAQITLTEPRAIGILMEPNVYPNGYNVSCTDCYNGSIEVTVQAGVPPYSYMWHDGATIKDRTELGADNHRVTVSDSNGCVQHSETLFLRQPDQDGWSMTGTTGTDPAIHYIGTADSVDLVLKSNGEEVIRLTSNGKLKLSGSTEGTGVLMLDEDGTLRGGGVLPVVPPMPVGVCGDLDVWPFWETDGNDFSALCEGEPRLGTISQTALSIITGDVQQMRIATNGQTQVYGITGIAADDINPFLSFPSRLNVYAADGQWLRMSTGTNKHWRIMPTLGTSEEGPGLRFHFTEGNFPPTNGLGPLALFEDGGLRAGSSLRVLPNGKVSIGEVNTNTPDWDYMLYVEGGLLTERVKVALKTSTEWSDHVFLPGYRLMPLADVECFIQENGHLPGVPTADQMVEQGLDVVKTDAMLMEKIEELTLHTIDLNTRLEHAERMIATLMEQLTRITE